MTNEEALRLVRGYLTDILPSECFDELEEIMSVLERPKVIAKITFDKEELNQIVEERILNPIKNGELVIKEERSIGEWIEEPVPIGLVGRGNGQYRCSICQHRDIQAKTQEVPFCWYCGAKMKKEAENE